MTPLSLAKWRICGLAKRVNMKAEHPSLVPRNSISASTTDDSYLQSTLGWTHPATKEAQPVHKKKNSFLIYLILPWNLFQKLLRNSKPRKSVERPFSFVSKKKVNERERGGTLTTQLSAFPKVSIWDLYSRFCSPYVQSQVVLCPFRGCSKLVVFRDLETRLEEKLSSFIWKTTRINYNTWKQFNKIIFQIYHCH